MLTRHINPNFDSKPSIHHIFNFKIAKPHIKNKSVLDIGCWTGQFEKLAVKSAKKIVGIDPNKKAIEYAKKNIKDAQFKVASVFKLPFKNNFFDTVVFLEVLEHLPRNTEIVAINEIYRVLKTGGYFILSTPNKHPVSVLLDPEFFLIGHRHYSFNKLKILLESCGFEIINKYYTGGIIKLITSSLSLISKHIICKTMPVPNWAKKAIEKEYYNGGSANIHLITKKKTRTH